MCELRHGIKLKKVEFSRTPTEFELTPYEMLMADIRKRSYKLQRAEIPARLKTDAKDIILEFIRSRPPLRPAANRQLAPRVQSNTPMESLLEVSCSKSLLKLCDKYHPFLSGNSDCQHKMSEENRVSR